MGNETGTIRTGIAHIITGVIGAGVLSLGWNVAQLGWVAGPIALLLFAGVTLVATFLLCDCYRAPDPDIGPIVNSSYMNAVTHFLGTLFLPSKQFEKSVTTIESCSVQ